MENLELKLDLKTLTEDGTFTGYLSVFNNTDSYGDVVEKGAFVKTLADQRGQFPMLWQHDTAEPIGIMQGAEDDYGLKVTGVLNLAVARANEAYALLKQGAIKGLSIGYVPVKWEMVGQARHLQEIKLYEGSVVTFPANPASNVDAVKSGELAALVEQMKSLISEFRAVVSEPSAVDTRAFASEDTAAPDEAAVRALIAEMRSGL